MSLMHLLSVSRSFENVEDRPGNYKLGTEGSLPKFDSSRPAISLPATRKPVSTAPVTARQGSLFSELVARPALEKKEVSSVAPVSQKTVVPAPAVPVSTSAPANPAVHQPLNGPLFERRPKDNKWKTMIKELFFGRRRRRSSEAIYQGELALQNVTVVRNDLRDADIEVVPTPKMDPTPFAIPAASTKKVVPPHKNARDWVKLTAGLIRPKKTEFYPSQGVASAAEQNRTPDLIARR